MPLWIDEMYVDQIAVQLKKFKKKRDGVWEFRCTYCGDSKKDPNKCRGHFLEKGGCISFYCHNCGEKRSLYKFISEHDHDMCKRYQLDKFKEGGKGFTNPNKLLAQPPRHVPRVKEEAPTPKKSLFDAIMTPVSDLEEGHEAREYIIMERKIPEKFWDDIFYIDDMRKIAQLAEKYRERLEKKKFPEARIVLPIRDRFGKVVGVTCRALEKNAVLRYIEIKIDDDAALIYGLDRVDLTRQVKVVEGAFDSMFLDNCVAANGSSLDKIRNHLTDPVLVYDAQPRNKELVSQIRKSIKSGFAIALLPETGYKDINQMVQAGIAPEKIEKLIFENTYRGLRAELAFSKWKKIDDIVPKKNLPRGFKK